MNRTYYAIQSAEREANIYIFGDITPYRWLENDVSARGIVNEIEGLDVDAVNVHIDSYGGSVSEGWAIYNALRKHPAKVRTYGDGFVASAALYPFLAGDERVASSLSAYYLHQVMIETSGYADDLRAAANEADLMTDIGINAFVEQAGMDADTVRELMKSETWLTPQQALAYGVATSITADASPSRAQAAKQQIMQCVYAAPGKSPDEARGGAPLRTDTAGSLMQTLAGHF